MGDAVNTTWDVLMFLVIFGGVPALIVGIPLAVMALLGSIRRRSRRSGGRNARSTEA